MTLFNSKIPADVELPSTGKLIRSTIIAIVSAIVLLVTIVMPSEYGIDPTGVGDLLGLKKMGEIKVALEEEIAAEKPKDAVISDAKAEVAPDQAGTQSATNGNSHEMKVILAPDQAAEIKLKMNKGRLASYTWWSDKGQVNFNVHGDSESLKIKYHPYYKGSDKRREGSIEAAFNGYHGWFWRNRTKEQLVVTLQTQGDYLEIKRVQ